LLPVGFAVVAFDERDTRTSLLVPYRPSAIRSAYPVAAERCPVIDYRVSRLPAPIRWGLVTLVAGVILYSSLIEPPGAGLAPAGPFGLVGLDKWLHALAYGALAAVLAVALARDALAALVLVVCLAIGYGIGIELVQATVPERSASALDAAADACGALASVAGWRALARRARLLEPARADGERRVD
jgi:VanZ family protein